MDLPVDVVVVVVRRGTKGKEEARKLGGREEDSYHRRDHRRSSGKGERPSCLLWLEFEILTRRDIIPPRRDPFVTV
jgi:hypothetical protein